MNNISKKLVCSVIGINSLLLVIYIILVVVNLDSKSDLIGTIPLGIGFFLLATMMYIAVLKFDEHSKSKLSTLFWMDFALFMLLFLILIVTTVHRGIIDFARMCTFFIFLIFTFETRLLEISVRYQSSKERRIPMVASTCFAYVVLVAVLMQLCFYYGEI